MKHTLAKSLLAQGTDMKSYTFKVKIEEDTFPDGSSFGTSGCSHSREDARGGPPKHSGSAGDDPGGTPVRRNTNSERCGD
jgi:hypothetical protein